MQSLTPSFFVGKLIYKNINLADTSTQMIPAEVLFDVARFIDDALAKQGRVYVHCQKVRIAWSWNNYVSTHSSFACL